MLSVEPTFGNGTAGRGVSSSPPLPLSLLQVSLGRGLAACLGGLILSDPRRQRCSGLLVPQQDPQEQGSRRGGFPKTQPLFPRQLAAQLAGDGAVWRGSYPSPVKVPGRETWERRAFFCQDCYAAVSLLLIFSACAFSIRPCKCHRETAIEGMYKQKYVK